MFDMSVSGLIFCAMMLFMMFAAAKTQANLLFAVFGLMVGVIIVSAVISRVMLARIQLQRTLPEYGTVGRLMGIEYLITNRKRFWPTFSMTVAEMDGVEGFLTQPHAYLLNVAPGASTSTTVEVIAKRRGLLRLRRLQFQTSFPFGFIRRAVDRSISDLLLIHPAIGRVDPQVLKLCLSAETSGAMMRPRRGGMDEFYGVRDYRAGENPRWIYWRRSARTGALVLREMTHVSPPRILMLVDTFLPDRSLDCHADVERAIAMAGSLAGQAMEQGHPVGLLAWGEHGWLHLAPNRGKRHGRDILAALAKLPLNGHRSERQLMDESVRYRESGTTVVLLTPRDVRLSLGESARGGRVVLSATSPQAQEWFKFPATVDFRRCMPEDQLASLDASNRRSDPGPANSDSTGSHPTGSHPTGRSVE
jgi:uncharacterized protein (DUF58 family)